MFKQLEEIWAIHSETLRMQSEGRINYEYVTHKQPLKERNTQGKYLPVWAYLMIWYFISWPLPKTELSALTVKHCSWVLMSRSEPNILYISLGMYFPTRIVLCLAKMIHFAQKSSTVSSKIPMRERNKAWYRLSKVSEIKYPPQPYVQEPLNGHVWNHKPGWQM